MRKITIFFSTLILSAMLSMQVFAVEFTTTPTSKAMYTSANTQVFSQPDAGTSPVMVTGAGIPVQVTGITSNGWYQISVNGIYYVPGNELTEGTAHSIGSAPVSTARTYETAISVNVNSVAEMQNAVNRALNAHADTLHMTSSTNIFNSTASYIEALIGGQNGDYVTHSCNGYRLNRRNNSYTVTFEYLATAEEDQASDAYIQQTAPGLVGANTAETVRKVHNYICNLTDYSDATAMGQAELRSPYDAITSKQTVCTGYALLFQRYMDMLGIPCTTAAGSRNGGPHMWNIVNVDGQWYHIDCTWDDQKTYVSDKWLLCGSDTAGYSTWGNLTLASGTLR